MLRQALKSLWGDKTEEKIKSSDIAPTDRAENVSIEGYVRLANSH